MFLTLDPSLPRLSKALVNLGFGRLASLATRKPYQGKHRPPTSTTDNTKETK